MTAYRFETACSCQTVTGCGQGYGNDGNWCLCSRHVPMLAYTWGNHTVRLSQPSGSDAGRKTLQPRACKPYTLTRAAPREWPVTKMRVGVRPSASLSAVMRCWMSARSRAYSKSTFSDQPAQGNGGSVAAGWLRKAFDCTCAACQPPLRSQWTM